MIFKIFLKTPILREMLYRLALWRAEEKVKQILPCLRKKDKILDVGAGNCMISRLLKKKGFKVLPLDIENLSFIKNIKPLLYNGQKIPFKDNEFDKALLLTVLHHTKKPEKLLLEAKRVSKRIIIIEEIYDSLVDKYLTYLIDSLFNLEFFGHPHTNKKDKEWKALFKTLGLRLKEAKYRKSAFFLKRVIYYLEKNYRKQQQPR